MWSRDCPQKVTDMYGGIVVPPLSSVTLSGDEPVTMDETSYLSSLSASTSISTSTFSSSSSMHRPEACLLVDVLLASVRTWGEDATLTIVSSPFEASMVAILRREELSEHVWEASVSIPLGDEAPFVRLLGGLCQCPTYPSTLPSSPQLHRSVADRVISLCVASWQSLQCFCSDHGLLLQSAESLLPLPPPPGSTFSAQRCYIDGITARLLATILHTHSVGDVEFEGIGPYVLRLLFCCLSNELICMEITQRGIDARLPSVVPDGSTPALEQKIELATQDELQGNDVMGIFLHCLHTRMNVPSSSSKDGTELLLQQS